MPKLYYGTDEFDVLEFEHRKVIDEIHMSMSALNCVLPDNAGIYCSSDITSGKWLYYDLLKKHDVSSSEILIEKIGEPAFRDLRKPFLDANVARGNKFAQELRERGFNNVVTPGPFYASKFTQPHYLYLWEWVIIKKICEARFNSDWEYSNGCTLEYAIAARKGIPRLDHEGSPLSLESAIGRVEAAVAELKKEGFLIPKLQENLELLRAIQK
jgi:hypothetical protein